MERSTRKSIIKTTLVTTLAVTGAIVLLVADKQKLFDQPFLVWQAQAVGEGSKPELATREFLKSQRGLQNLFLRYHVQNTVTRGNVETSKDEDASSSTTYKVHQRYELASNDFSKITLISASASRMSEPGTYVKSDNPRYRMTFSDLFFGFTLVLIIIAAGSFEQSEKLLSRYPPGLSSPSLVLYIVLIGVLASISLVNPIFNLPKLGFILLLGSGLVVVARWLFISRRSWYQASLPQGFLFLSGVCMGIALLEAFRLSLPQP